MPFTVEGCALSFSLKPVLALVSCSECDSCVPQQDPWRWGCSGGGLILTLSEQQPPLRGVRFPLSSKTRLCIKAGGCCPRGPYIAESTGLCEEYEGNFLAVPFSEVWFSMDSRALAMFSGAA